MNVGYVDLETGGFGSKAAILEIFCLIDQKTFHEYGLPDGDQEHSEGAIAINGLSLEVLKEKNALAQKDLAELFYHFLHIASPEGVIFCAYNGDSFDLPIIKETMKKQEFDFKSLVCPQTIDIIKIARNKIPASKIENYKLGTVAKYFEIETRKLHTAEEDVRVMIEIEKRLRQL